MANYEKVITASRWETARRKSDEEDYDDDFVFSEERDGFPLREFVLHAIEGEITHDAGVGTMDDFEDGIHGRAPDWAKELTPDGIPDSVVDSFENEIRETVLEYGRPVYRDILSEARSWADSTEDWEEYIPEDGDERPEQWQKVDAFFKGRDSVSDVRRYAKRKVERFDVPERK